jgi:TolA-binding protein
MKIGSFLKWHSLFPISTLAAVALIVLALISRVQYGKNPKANLMNDAASLHDAVKQGDLAKVKALLKNNPKLILGRENKGGMPASGHDGKELAELPLAGDAEINAKDKTLFESGTSYLQEGQYIQSRRVFAKLINKYPDSDLAPEAIFGIADSYYEEGGTENLLQAEDGYKNFVIFYPDSPKAPEAQLKIIALNVQKMGPSDRDQEYAHRALKEIERFEKKFPNSDFSAIVNRLKFLTQSVLPQ